MLAAKDRRPVRTWARKRPIICRMHVIRGFHHWQVKMFFQHTHTCFWYMLIWLGIDYESNQTGKLRWICLCIFIYIYLYLLYIFRSSSMWCNLMHLPCNPIILGTWLSCKTDCSFDGLDTTGTTAAIPSWILIQMHTSSNFGDNGVTPEVLQETVHGLVQEFFEMLGGGEAGFFFLVSYDHPT